MWTEKYRPKTFKHYHSHEEIVKTLKYLIKRFRLKGIPIPHILLSGPQGIGKTTLANIMSNELGAEVKEMNASLYGKIDNVREVIDRFTQYLSVNGVPKVLILDEAHGLSAEAQNALNRIMEIRGNRTLFIFCTNDEDAIIPTIRSRCAVMRFSKMKAYDIVESLKPILKRERVRYNLTTLQKLARVSDGDLRKAIITAETYAPTLNGYGVRPIWMY